MATKLAELDEKHRVPACICQCREYAARSRPPANRPQRGLCATRRKVAMAAKESKA